MQIPAVLIELEESNESITANAQLTETKSTSPNTYLISTRSQDKKRLSRGKNNSEASSYMCKECGKNFMNSTGLRKHSAIHTDEKPFECQVCGIAFARSDYLKVHMRLHTGERPFECSRCKLKFIQGTHLKRHLKTHANDKDDDDVIMI